MLYNTDSFQKLIYRAHWAQCRAGLTLGVHSSVKCATVRVLCFTNFVVIHNTLSVQGGRWTQREKWVENDEIVGGDQRERVAP